jgi:hypothetical protein
MQNRGENEDFYQPDLGDFPTEPEPIFFGFGSWKVSYTGDRALGFREKLDMWVCAYRGDITRGAVVCFALGVMWWTGHNSARMDFERAIRAGLYVENATMKMQLEKPAAWVAFGTEEEGR